MALYDLKRLFVVTKGNFLALIMRRAKKLLEQAQKYPQETRTIMPQASMKILQINHPPQILWLNW